jgi:hypothetical protein
MPKKAQLTHELVKYYYGMTMTNFLENNKAQGEEDFMRELLSIP